MTVGQQVPAAGAASLHAEEVLTLFCCCCALGHLIIVATPSLWSSIKLHWVKLTQVHAAAPPLLALWGKAIPLQADKTWLSKDGGIMGCQKDNWQVYPQIPGFLHPAKQHGKKPSTIQQSPSGFTSPAFPAQMLPWAWRGGEGCGNSCCVDTAALEWHPKSQPRSTPSLSLLHKHAFEHLL